MCPVNWAHGKEASIEDRRLKAEGVNQKKYMESGSIGVSRRIVIESGACFPELSV
jgi:hypothetical protein